MQSLQHAKAPSSNCPGVPACGAARHLEHLCGSSAPARPRLGVESDTTRGSRWRLPKPSLPPPSRNWPFPPPRGFGVLDPSSCGGVRDRAEQAAIQMGYQGCLRHPQWAGRRHPRVGLRSEHHPNRRRTLLHPLELELRTGVDHVRRAMGTELNTLLPGESTTIQVDFGRVPVAAISGPVEIELCAGGRATNHAGHHHIRLPPAGHTSLQWDVGLAPPSSDPRETTAPACARPEIRTALAASIPMNECL